MFQILIGIALATNTASAQVKITPELRSQIKTSREAWSKQRLKSYSYFLADTGWTGSEGSILANINEGRPNFQLSCDVSSDGVLHEKIERDANKVKTIDQLYDSCEHNVLADAQSEGSEVWVQFDKNGTLARCEYYRKDCADCGAAGFHILNLAIAETDDIKCGARRITFENNGSALTESAKNELKDLGRFLRSTGSVKFMVAGHGDQRGSVESNLVIGEIRARTVKAYLVSQGVNPSKLEVMSYGKEKPLVDPSKPENRRVQIRYLSP